MQSFKNQIKTFFNFNKRQERGAFVLIVLIILAFGIDLLLPKIIKEEPFDFSSTIAEIEAWEASAVKETSQKTFKSKTKISNKTENEVIILTPFEFNPNKFPKDRWLEMGMPESVVNTILKYESAGGSFKKVDDLQKIYGLTDEIFAQLKDFIQIPPKETLKETIHTLAVSLTEESETIILLDINRADSVDLLQVRGIGPFYAGQIVKYRQRLGGYNSLEQIKELYKMDSSRFFTLLPYLTFKDTILNRIDINTADFKTVLKHPYIDYETTKKILNHRNRLGRYAGLYQLKKDSILSDSLFTKLKPYLKVD
ncbi:MAG: helix-hairpin-helix domain-containing protein [Bacteroidales bacterium]|jgi:competence protein ComEA|nr:helix-hairpin-helix domain-containing protein [Bacteroidales bacterium]